MCNIGGESGGDREISATRHCWSIGRALYDVFPHSTAWRHYPGGPLLLITTKERLQIDYQKLRERMQNEHVRQDLELIGVKDVDHLLSNFIFDEEAFAEFAQTMLPVTDDMTVVDFRSPYHLGSGFGLGAFTPLAREGHSIAMVAGHKRSAFYSKQRRSVAPYLTNLAMEDREEVAKRISRRFRLRSKILPVPRAKWRRWEDSTTAE